MTDAATHAEAVLALWLSGVAVALALVVAAFVCHSHRDTQARIRLLEHKMALPELRREVDSWTERVAESALAADHAVNGEARPAETRVAGAQNSSEAR